MGHPFWLAGFVLKAALALSFYIVLLCNCLDISFVKATLGSSVGIFNTLGCMLSVSEDLKIFYKWLLLNNLFFLITGTQ